jgi:hypothetical protein
MQHPIKAIETQYKGYRFRSRLEARWAVFFDTLGVKWEYEPEGFELPSGRYLPDFWLPESMLWIEVKPTEPTAREKLLAEELYAGTRSRVYISEGVPRGDNGWLFAGPYGWVKGMPRLCRAGVLGPLSVGDHFVAFEAARSARFEFGQTGAIR